MKLTFSFVVVLVALSTARAASPLTSAQVIARCQDAEPTQTPVGWQDFQYTATGKVIRTKTGYTLRGKLNSATGTCIVTMGKNGAIFVFDNFKKVQAELDAQNAPYRFGSACDRAVIKLAGVPDAIQDRGNINVVYHKLGDIKKVAGGFTDTNEFFGEYYSCSGSIESVRVKFINQDAPAFILKAFKAQADNKGISVVDAIPNLINAVSGYDNVCEQDKKFALLRAQEPVRAQIGNDIEPRWIFSKGYGVDGTTSTVRRLIDVHAGEAGLRPLAPWNNYDGGFGRSYTASGSPGFIYLLKISDYSSGGVALCVAATLAR